VLLEVEDVGADLGAAIKVAVMRNQLVAERRAMATISPVGAMMQLWPISTQFSSLPALPTPTTHMPLA
jgi:hypothetical protein